VVPAAAVTGGIRKKSKFLVLKGGVKGGSRVLKEGEKRNGGGEEYEKLDPLKCVNKGGTVLSEVESRLKVRV
jgi:hypothetical protein